MCETRPVPQVDGVVWEHKQHGASAERPTRATGVTLAQRCQIDLPPFPPPVLER